MEDEDSINIQIFIPELQVRKCLVVQQDDFVWDVKRTLLAQLPQALTHAFNYGLFLPPCDGRAGKFLLEDRTIRDYPFHDCVPYLELKYKKRVYKLLNLDEKQLKNLHTKSNLRKLMDYVQAKNAEKVEKLCTQGLDANFHDAQGETPLTLASGIPNNRAVIVALIGGGAHIDFRNNEGQTAMHKASFLSSVDNVKTLLELGASPNYRDPLALTPLYYNMLTTDSNDQVSEMLLREAAQFGVTDMHGNHELHQACKNGLVKHVEHLLYFGVEVDVQNINGNTPLHVCAVNNRPEVARVLLFRGADCLITNKQNQTALHVAHIVGSHEVAEIINGHNPQMSVPYRGTPQYSTRRRLSSTISRRRSLSQSSLCSQDIYRTPQQARKTPIAAPSPTPSRISRSTITPSEYGTMRRYAPEVQGLAPGQETNTPRILVIPRGPKGFGFILRGAKHADAAIEFIPSAASPALQFFEGVDMSGMAMKAGLRPGDFLLEIDGIDVRCASHEQVVHLIQQAGDTITLKVITIEGEPQLGGTVQRRHHSVGRAPPPPMRHPSTSLSLRGSQSLYGFIGEPNFYAAGDNMSHYGDSRHASVRQRATAGRRISAAELENLMIRQQNQQQYQQIAFDQESLSSQTAKKYNSVSDMKRRKQRCAPSPQLQGLHRTNNYEFDQAPQPLNSIYGSPMKTYGSSPDIPRINSFELTDDDSPTPLPTHERLDDSEYSRPFRPPSRPKTPPPPPPPQNMQSHSRLSGTPSCYEPVSNSSTIRGVSRLSAVSNIHVSAPSPSAPPPAPPPPPAVTSAPKPPPAPSGGSVPPPPPPPPADLHLKGTHSAPTLAAPTPQRSIMASALQNQANLLRKVVPPPENKPAASSSVPDFQADLRNALAKRRSKVANDEDDDERRDQVNNRLGGLSLRESVRENVSSKDSKQHSPPGIAHKKDSGYTSSRTSLERSECGDDRLHGDHVHPTFTLDNSNHKVSIISQNIEENYGRQKQQPDTMSISSFSTISGSSTSDPKKPHLPPVDYDFVDEDPDSGTGDSDGEFRITNGSTFERKSLTEWSCGDVLSWLHSINLGEYSDAFRSRRVCGSALSSFDRTAFTQLGVTRIGHRQKMENSIRNYLTNNDN